MPVGRYPFLSCHLQNTAVTGLVHLGVLAFIVVYGYQILDNEFCLEYFNQQYPIMLVVGFQC